MPPIGATSEPSAFRYSAAVGRNGLFDSESTSVAANRATTTSVTPSATEDRSSVARMRRQATAAPYSEMSQVHRRSEPWRPAHTAETRYRGFKGLSVAG